MFSLFEGDGFCVGCCKAGVSCLFGAIGGGLAAALPSKGSCIINIATGLASSLSAGFCDTICGTGNNSNITCAVIGALIEGVAGCAVSAVSDLALETDRFTGELTSRGTTELGLMTAVSALVGYDIAKFCEIFTPVNTKKTAQHRDLYIRRWLEKI